MFIDSTLIPSVVVVKRRIKLISLYKFDAYYERVTLKSRTAHSF
jgi:hypothetical protein